MTRDKIFTDSFAQLAHKSSAEMKGQLAIKFRGEKGLDYGGVARDYFVALSREMFNPNYSLFTPTSNGVSFHANYQSGVNPDHLNFFRFIGRMIGKALIDDRLLELHFSKPMYKMMVGDDLDFSDMRDLDNEFYNSSKWVLDNNPQGLGMVFSTNTDYFGKSI